MTCGCNVVDAAWDEVTKQTLSFLGKCHTKPVCCHLITYFPLLQIHKKKTTKCYGYLMFVGMFTAQNTSILVNNLRIS